MKKVLVFFPNCQIGGTEEVISLMSEFFNRDYELYLLTICQNEKKYNYFYKDFFVLDNSYLYKKNLLNKIIKYKNWIKETKNVINKTQPNIILPFGEILNFIVIYLKIFNYINSKVIVNVRNSESVFLEKAQFGKIIKLSMKFMYDRIDLVLTNSNGSKIDLIDNIGVKNKIEVVYNPVRKCKEEKKEIKTKKRIIHIGRLNTQKAQHYLIEAIDKPGENGILLKVGDVKGLSESIAKVLNDDEYREKLSQNAYKRALDFDVEKIYLEFKKNRKGFNKWLVL